MLKIHNISKTFNPGTVNEKQALSNLSLHLNKGDFVTIIGRRMPGLLYDKNRAEKYQKRYDALVIKYRNRETPPTDDEKD